MNYLTAVRKQNTLFCGITWTRSSHLISLSEREKKVMIFVH